MHRDRSTISVFRNYFRETGYLGFIYGHRSNGLAIDISAAKRDQEPMVQSKSLTRVALTCLLFLLANPFPSNAAPPLKDLTDLGNKAERLEWLQDAGFGMFIHWSHDSQIGSVSNKLPGE